MQKIEIPVVIVANGDFPTNKIPLELIKRSKTIIACDGAADTIIKDFGIVTNKSIDKWDISSAKDFLKAGWKVGFVSIIILIIYANTYWIIFN